MIAAAMTTRKSNPPTYVDLAKAGAQIRRDIEPQSCIRLQAAAEALNGVRTTLTFGWDDQARLRVNGQATAELQLSCHLCTEPVALELVADVNGVLARNEDEAQFWRDQDADLNIIMVSGAELDELELVEDELLLRLPSKVCVDAACERRPDLAYPAADAAEQQDQRPFAALAELKRDLQAAKK